MQKLSEHFGLSAERIESMGIADGAVTPAGSAVVRSAMTPNEVLAYVNAGGRVRITSDHPVEETAPDFSFIEG